MFAGLLKFAKFFTGKIIRSKANTNSNQASGKTKGTKNDGKTNSDQGTKEADGTNQGSKTSSTNGRYTKEFIKDLEDIEKFVTKRRFNINVQHLKKAQKTAKK